MPRTLTAAMIAEKEAASYEDVVMVVITGDSVTLRYATEAYTLSGNDYQNLIRSLGQITVSVRTGGGLAAVSDWQFALNNFGRFSNIADVYTFENDQMDAYLIFKTGSETDSDRIQLVRAIVRDIDFDEEDITFMCRDSTLRDLVGIPRERVNLGVFPNAPIGEVGKPLPVPFGYLDDQPVSIFFDSPRYGFRKLSPTVCIDEFARTYVFGNCMNLDLPAGILYSTFAYYQEVRQFGVNPLITANTDALGPGYDTYSIWDGTGTAYRVFEISPITAKGTSISNVSNAIDRDLSTPAGTIDSGVKLLTCYFGGITKLGTISGASELIQIQVRSRTTVASCGNLQIRHPRLTTINQVFGDGTDADEDWTYQFLTADIATIDERWDFESLEIEFSQVGGAGNVRIYEVVLQIEVNTIAVQSYQRVEQYFGSLGNGGYKNYAEQYADGSIISGPAEGDVLQNPADILVAILRDRRTMLNIAVADIDTTSFSDARTALSGWIFDFTMYKFTGDVEGTRRFLDRFCRQAGMILQKSFEGKWKVKVLDPDDDPVYFFGPHNIAVENPDADPEDQKSTVEVKASPISEVYNDFLVRYGFNYARENYDLFLAASGRYLASGTNGATNVAPGTTFTSAGATFESDFILAGHILYVRSGDGATVGVYTIVSVDSETQLTLATSPGNSLTGIEYYAGPYLNATCVESYIEYGELNTFPEDESEWEFIQDDTTAESLLDFLVDTYALRRWKAELSSWWNAITVEVGDLVLIDDALIPFKSQKRAVGCVLDGAIDDSQTDFDVIGDTPTIGQYVQIGEGPRNREIATVTNVVSQTVTVTRGAAGTVAAAHDDASMLYWHPVKWRVMETPIMPETPELGTHFTLRQENIPDDLVPGQYDGSQVWQAVHVFYL